MVTLSVFRISERLKVKVPAGISMMSPGTAVSKASRNCSVNGFSGCGAQPMSIAVTMVQTSNLRATNFSMLVIISPKRYAAIDLQQNQRPIDGPVAG